MWNFSFFHLCCYDCCRSRRHFYTHTSCSSIYLKWERKKQHIDESSLRLDYLNILNFHFPSPNCSPLTITCRYQLLMRNTQTCVHLRACVCLCTSPICFCRYIMATSTKNLDKSPSALLRDNVRQIKEHTKKLQSDAHQAVRNMPVVLTEQQLKRLKEHKYASEGVTLFDPVMQEFWKWLVEFCPLWVAPNLLTIVGLALNIGTSVLLMIETNGAKEEVCDRSHLRVKSDRHFLLVFSMVVLLHGTRAIFLSVVGRYRWQTSTSNEFFDTVGWTLRSRLWFGLCW